MQMSPKPYLPPLYTTLLMPSGCGGSRDFPLNWSCRRVGTAKMFFYYQTTFSSVLSQEGTGFSWSFLCPGLLVVMGWSLLKYPIWNVWATIRKLGELTTMLFFKSWGPRQPTFFFHLLETSSVCCIMSRVLFLFL